MTDVVLRADASAELGVGHVMRTLTLGAALVDAGHGAVLVSTELPPALRARAARAGVPVVDSSVPAGDGDDAEQLVAVGARVAVVDGYRFDRGFFDTLRSGRVRHLVVDDNREVPLTTASAVLNQNLHADTAMYDDLAADVRRLLGPTYALLRPEIVALVGQPRAARTTPAVFVAVGGTDVLDVEPTIVAAVRRLDGIDVVTPAPDTLPEIAGPLHAADLAIVGAGSTMWECLALGVPMVALVVADNQRAAAAECARRGLASVVDCRHRFDEAAVVEAVVDLLADAPRRRRAAALGRELVDGRGARRVVRAIEDLLGPET